MPGGRLEGRIALITGAGRGIGRGIALAMAREGADVSIVEIDARTAESTAEEVRKIGVRAVALPCDVRTREACLEAVRDTVQALGGIDVLVNNAAWSEADVPLLETTDESFDRTWEVNTKATFWLMQACHPHLVARGGGSIVNFASAAGTQGVRGFAAYAAAKEANRALTRVAANEWGRDGITVNVVCPMAASPGWEQWAAKSRGQTAAHLAQVPLGRVGDCERDIGRVVAFLASDDARYVTGQTMMVDGGFGTFR